MGGEAGKEDLVEEVEIENALIGAQAKVDAGGIEDAIGGRGNFEVKAVGATGLEVAVASDFAGKDRGAVVGRDIADDFLTEDGAELFFGLLNFLYGFKAARVMETGVVTPLIVESCLGENAGVAFEDGDVEIGGEFEGAAGAEEAATHDGDRGTGLENGGGDGACGLEDAAAGAGVGKGDGESADAIEKGFEGGMEEGGRGAGAEALEAVSLPGEKAGVVEIEEKAAFSVVNFQFAKALDAFPAEQDIGLDTVGVEETGFPLEFCPAKQRKGGVLLGKE